MKAVEASVPATSEVNSHSSVTVIDARDVRHGGGTCNLNGYKSGGRGLVRAGRRDGLPTAAKRPFGAGRSRVEVADVVPCNSSIEVGREQVGGNG